MASNRREGRLHGGQGGHGGQWQRKMFIKLIKDKSASFELNDVPAFLNGMDSFESKPELLTILANKNNHGKSRLHDCLSMISGPSCIDNILARVLSNVITKETSRPLHKARRGIVVNMIFSAPGLVEYLATEWIRSINNSSQETIELLCKLLVDASLSLLEARSSNHVKSIARGIRESSFANVDSHRLCAILQLDTRDVRSEEPKMKKRKSDVACWGTDLIPPGGRHDNDHSNFRDIALIPTREELAYKGSPWLPLASGENSHVADPEERMLDTSFRLLREDFVSSMKEKILSPKRVWHNARIIGASCWDDTLYFFVQLDYPSDVVIDWDHQKYFSFDSVIAFCDSENQYMIGSVFIRENAEEGRWLNSCGGPVIGVIFHCDNDINQAISDTLENKYINEAYQSRITQLWTSRSKENEKIKRDLGILKKNLKTYDVIEVSDSFFSYRPVLESIQSMRSVPLSQELVHIRSQEGRPSYLPQKIKLPSIFKNLECDLEEWCHEEITAKTSLDESQSRALHMALTSRVALIQGPPGTGKTFIGSLVAEIIRSNSDESILCVCYTNHALDQFLEHLLEKGETRLVRIGRRTKSEALRKFELKELAKKGRIFPCNDTEGRLKDVYDELNSCCDEKRALLQSIQVPISWEELKEIFQSMGTNILMNFEADKGDGVPFLDRNGNNVSQCLFNLWKGGDDCPEWWRNVLRRYAGGFRNLWVVNPCDRLRLLHDWERERDDNTTERIQELNQRVKDLTAEKLKLRNRADMYVLKDARVIGATTTGAAKYKDVLSNKCASVVIVEEAGEVLEPHIISALTEANEHTTETKHLILIGDHLQLRPKLESYQLTKVSGNGFDFDVSLFERLILSGFESSMLKLQHRMRPNIADIIRHQTYPTLEDHPSVTEYPIVKGVSSSVLFIDHTNLEDGLNGDELTTKSNEYEAALSVEISRFLILQGYNPNQITVLTPYVGQILAISKEIKKRMEDISTYISDTDRETLHEDSNVVNPVLAQSGTSKSIRVASIDNFQGEESDIVVISLVRSNNRGTIGFLKEKQRVNVLLSRAKHAMFIIGNSKTLCSSYAGKRVWDPIIKMFESQKYLVESFPVVCQLHPTDEIIYCKNTSDFRSQRPNGGCCRPCNIRLECGHVCPLACHPTDRSHIKIAKLCTQPCRRTPPLCPRNHQCPKLCNEDCGNCLQIVEDKILLCGHVAKAPQCHAVRNDNAVKTLSIACKEEVLFKFSPCNHECITTCSNKQKDQPVCPAVCGQTLDCGHACTKSCHTGVNGHSCGKKCERILFCGHMCSKLCHGSEKCPPCSSKCESKCVHSNCSGMCYQVCSSCVEACDWECEHKGSCTLVCEAPCNRLPCNERCRKKLGCGHQCPSVCGEDCPEEEYCIECCEEETKSRVVDVIEFKSYKDHDVNKDPVIFLNCGHFFSTSSLDGIMEINNGYEKDDAGNFSSLKALSMMGTSKPKLCPDCRSIIMSVKRYGRIISYHSLRTLEMKHVMRVNGLLQECSEDLEKGPDSARHERVIQKLDDIEVRIKKSPMTKVYEACGGKDLDVPSPPSQPLLELYRLQGLCVEGLVDGKDSDWYGRAIKIYDDSITLADESTNKRQGSLLRLQLCRLLIKWNSIDEIKPKAVSLLQWVIDLDFDASVKSEAMQMKSNIENSAAELKEVVNAMNVVHGYNYGGGWSSHWYECPNGHPYFIGECGGAMQVGRCIECGEQVGGQRHRLLGSNRSAAGAVADAMRGDESR